MKGRIVSHAGIVRGGGSGCLRGSAGCSEAVGAAVEAAVCAAGAVARASPRVGAPPFARRSKLSPPPGRSRQGPPGPLQVRPQPGWCRGGPEAAASAGAGAVPAERYRQLSLWLALPRPFPPGGASAAVVVAAVAAVSPPEQRRPPLLWPLRRRSPRLKRRLLLAWPPQRRLSWPRTSATVRPSVL